RTISGRRGGRNGDTGGQRVGKGKRLGAEQGELVGHWVVNGIVRRKGGRQQPLRASGRHSATQINDGDGALRHLGAVDAECDGGDDERRRLRDIQDIAWQNLRCKSVARDGRLIEPAANVRDGQLDVARHGNTLWLGDKLVVDRHRLRVHQG